MLYHSCLYFVITVLLDILQPAGHTPRTHSHFVLIPSLQLSFIPIISAPLTYAISSKMICYQLWEHHLTLQILPPDEDCAFIAGPTQLGQQGTGTKHIRAKPPDSHELFDWKYT